MQIIADNKLSLAGALLAGLMVIPLAGCPSVATVTVAQAVKSVAPSYRVRAPANGTADLGRRLLKDQPETNACFDGDKGTATPSWSTVSLNYAVVLDGKIHADLGTVLKINPSLSASAKRGATITLTDLVEEQLAGVYLNPSGACAGLFTEPSTSYANVLTRAIKAGTIEVTADESVAASLQVDVAVIGGVSTNAATSSGQKLQGASLFFADYPECFSVAHQKKECASSPVGPGHVCDLDPCSVQITALNTGSGAWTGKLSCTGGTAVDLAGTLGEWGKAQKTAPGVAYNVRVLAGTGLGLVNIDFQRWVTRSEAADKCEGATSTKP